MAIIAATLASGKMDFTTGMEKSGIPTASLMKATSRKESSKVPH